MKHYLMLSVTVTVWNQFSHSVLEEFQSSHRVFPCNFQILCLPQVPLTAMQNLRESRLTQSQFPKVVQSQFWTAFSWGFPRIPTKQVMDLKNTITRQALWRATVLYYNNSWYIPLNSSIKSYFLHCLCKNPILCVWKNSPIWRLNSSITSYLNVAAGETL